MGIEYNIMVNTAEIITKNVFTIILTSLFIIQYITLKTWHGSKAFECASLRSWSHRG